MGRVVSFPDPTLHVGTCEGLGMRLWKENEEERHCVCNHVHVYTVRDCVCYTEEALLMSLTTVLVYESWMSVE